MCKETFLRLPEEKRNRFLEAAWAEFTRVKFADVSINQIVRRAGVPRGSFYQYFADKEDLFSYLVNTAREGFLGGFQTALTASDGDLFAAMGCCFDQFQSWEQGEPVVDRGIQLLHINLGMDMRKIMFCPSIDQLLDAIWDRLDLRAFAQQDRGFVRQVLMVMLMVLASAIMDAMACPERTAEYRQRLCEQMEIIRYGALRGPREAQVES